MEKTPPNFSPWLTNASSRPNAKAAIASSPARKPSQLECFKTIGICCHQRQKKPAFHENQTQYPLVEIADQHHVAGHIALGQKQLLAVARPRELKNSPRRKIGYLPRRATQTRLFPDIGRAFPCQGILQTFLIGGP